MKKLGLFAASVGAALLCTAMPASLDLSRAGVTLLSLDTAQARVGRPRTPVSVAGVNRRVNRRAAVAGAVTAGAVTAGAVAAEDVAEDAYAADLGPAGVYGPAPALVAPAPYVTPGYVAGAYAGPAYYAQPYVVDPYTGRWCRIEASGYRWCWTP